MKISQPRATVRPTASSPKTQQAYSWPAPTMGWVANGNLAVSQPTAAYKMENFFPTATGIVMRRGSEVFKTISDNPVKSMFSYISGGLRRLFAADDENIYDITLTPTNIHPHTNGNWIVAQYQSSDGIIYLRGVNGSDDPFVFNGTAFSTTPALTFDVSESTTPDRLSYTWVYKNRFWFIQKDSLDAWYLPVGNIGGELTRFSLGGQLKLGGSLVMGATWSRDTGSGMNAMCAFFSSEGEVAIYQGDNPEEISTWALVGVFRIGKPLGARTAMDAGGDLIIATDIGFIPISTALQTDFAILGNAALSENIVDAWRDEVANRVGSDWHVAFWSARQMVIVALPTIQGETPVWLVVNARTKAWTQFTNWDATCVHVFNDRCFFGTPDGKIVEANVSGLDEGKPYTALCVPMFDQMGVAGHKAVSLLRAVIRGQYPVIEKMSVQSDYQLRIPSAPNAGEVQDQGLWGTAAWGFSEWGATTTVKNVYQYWQSAFGTGEVLAPCIQITSGSLAPLDAELVRIDATFTSGEIVV